MNRIVVSGSFDNLKSRQVRFLLQRGFAGDHVRHALGAGFDPDLGLELEADALDGGMDDEAE